MILYICCPGWREIWRFVSWSKSCSPRALPEVNMTCWRKQTFISPSIQGNKLFIIPNNLLVLNTRFPCVWNRCDSFLLPYAASIFVASSRTITRACKCKLVMPHYCASLVQSTLEQTPSCYDVRGRHQVLFSLGKTRSFVSRSRDASCLIRMLQLFTYLAYTQSAYIPARGTYIEILRRK